MPDGNFENRHTLAPNNDSLRAVVESAQKVVHRKSGIYPNRKIFAAEYS